MSLSIPIRSIENQDHWVYGLILKTIMCVEQYLSLSITISLGFIWYFDNYLFSFKYFILFVFVWLFRIFCSFLAGVVTEAYS